jgi:hypothetical protein
MNIEGQLVRKVVLHAVDKLFGDEMEKGSKDLYGEVVASCCESMLTQYKLSRTPLVVPETTTASASASASANGNANSTMPSVNKDSTRVKKETVSLDTIEAVDDTNADPTEPVPDTSGLSLVKVLDFLKKSGGCSVF